MSKNNFKIFENLKKKIRIFKKKFLKSKKKITFYFMES